MVLANGKHEEFAQLVAGGQSATQAYTSIYPGTKGVAASASRLLKNSKISLRIGELRQAVSDGLVKQRIRDKNHRFDVLQRQLDRLLQLQDARAALYANETDGSYDFLVADPLAEAKATLNGCKLKEPPPGGEAPAGYPKVMTHPGLPIGGATGMLVKDFRGKSAEQVIFRFDRAHQAEIRDTLRQAAIEEGDWNEDREDVAPTAAPVKVTVVFVTPAGQAQNSPVVEVPKSVR